MGDLLSAAWQVIVTFAVVIWGSIAAAIDISLPDAILVIGTISFPLTRIVKYRGQSRPMPTIESLMADSLRGAAFWSFILLIATAFSSKLFMLMFEHQRVHMILAGFIGAAAALKADKWLIEFTRDRLPAAPPPESEKMEAARPTKRRQRRSKAEASSAVETKQPTTQIGDDPPLASIPAQHPSAVQKSDS